MRLVKATIVISSNDTRFISTGAFPMYISGRVTSVQESYQWHNDARRIPILCVELQTRARWKTCPIRRIRSLPHANKEINREINVFAKLDYVRAHTKCSRHNDVIQQIVAEIDGIVVIRYQEKLPS